MQVIFLILPHLIIALALLGMVLQFAGAGARPRLADLADWIWSSARWLYGGYFVYTSIMIGRNIWAGNKGFAQPTPEAKAFYESLHATGFLYPLMGVTFGLGGLALLLHRSAPLGLALLAPSVGVIFLFHLMLTGNVIWGGEWAFGFLLLAWHYRSAFVGLWSYGLAGGGATATR